MTIKSEGGLGRFLGFCLGVSAGISAVADESTVDVGRKATNVASEIVIITATKEKKALSEVPSAVTPFDSNDLESINPSHPAEILNSAAGVYVNNLGGEGHMSAIRQPITTTAVYLFLEDGIPTRPSGFFNHNGLYELNIPQASRLEVVKGPGSALYGSGAIGGIINSFTTPPPENPEIELNLEGGGNGWERLLVSGGSNFDQEDSGFRVDLNVTGSDGFREAADYDKQSMTARLDQRLGGAKVKSVVSYSEIDQSGVSSLQEGDYLARSDHNQFHGDIGFREVEALRVSTEIAWQLSEESNLTMTPFYRNNEMTLMPSWMLTYDANIRTTEFESYGLLTKWRRSSEDGKAEVILGLDLDCTPSDTLERQIDADLDEDADIYFTYTDSGNLNYDYSATQQTVSPYIHSEFQLAETMKLLLGLRYDHFDVDYEDRLEGSEIDRRHLRPESQSLSYDETSPKLGMIWRATENSHIYTHYHHSFRAPSISALFRSGSSLNTDKLKPMKADSIEIGYRFGMGKHRVAIALYDLTKRDDVVSVITDEGRDEVNAGKTSHKGVEMEWQYRWNNQLDTHLAVSRAKHKYENFSYIGGSWGNQTTLNYAGFDVGKAPENLGNIKLNYYPIQLPQTHVQMELVHVGKYFTDETNENTYSGHSLVNYRINYSGIENTTLYARLLNAADKRYSTYTSNQVGSENKSYRPGMRRTIFAGFSYSF